MGGSCIMAVSAGRILILPKGSYDSTTTYEFLDAVYYQGSTYICKKTALNVLPSNTEYWQIMAQGTSSASVAGNYYAECDTSASTPAKVITVPATEYFVLQVGDIVNVKFTYTNTATNPTLNINNTGNKTIVYDTSAVTTDNLWAGGEAGRITSFMYDGTNWVWISHDVDTNTLSDLLDTTISSPTNKQGLIFNGTSNKWENKSLVAGDVIFDNTGTDLVSNDVNDSIVEVNNKKTNNSNLAPIEATTTASRSYLVGDYLMLQGEFYKVISAIAIGDTLTVGTNIQSTNVGDEIDEVNDYAKDLDIYALSITGFDSIFRLERVGRVCFITYNESADSLSTGSLTFSQTLPERFRPTHQVCVHSDETSAKVILFFNSDGTIIGYNYGGAISSKTTCRFGTLSYPALNK